MPADSLASIRALISATSNHSGYVKNLRDGDDGGREDLKNIGSTVTNLARNGNEAIKRNGQKISKVWDGIRKHIVQGSGVAMADLAAVSLNGVLSVVSQTSAAATVGSYKEDPYVVLMTVAARITANGIERNSNALKAAGLVLMVAAFGATVFVLGDIARAETKAYQAEAFVGKAVLKNLVGLVNRGIDLGQTNATYKYLDRNTHRDAMFNGQKLTQYDAYPADNSRSWPNPGNSTNFLGPTNDAWLEST